MNDPIVPRKRKVPHRFKIGTSTVDNQPTTSKSLYRQQYYEALDLITNCVCSRFKQPGYNTYKNLQELLFKAIKGEDFQPELQFVTQFYQDDINSTNLQVHTWWLCTGTNGVTCRLITTIMSLTNTGVMSTITERTSNSGSTVSTQVMLFETNKTPS